LIALLSPGLDRTIQPWPWSHRTALALIAPYGPGLDRTVRPWLWLHRTACAPFTRTIRPTRCPFSGRGCRGGQARHQTVAVHTLQGPWCTHRPGL